MFSRQGKEIVAKKLPSVNQSAASDYDSRVEKFSSMARANNAFSLESDFEHGAKYD